MHTWGDLCGGAHVVRRVGAESRARKGRKAKEGAGWVRGQWAEARREWEVRSDSAVWELRL